MKETAVQANERQIRNGLRKQREKIEREQQKVWDKLKEMPVTLNGMTIERKTVQARSRKIMAGWTIEEPRTLETCYHPDLIDELTAQILADGKK